MATTRAETTHTSKPVIGWGLSVVNSIKGRAKKHQETMPMIKIMLVVLGLGVFMLMYVTYVNKASTHGYFYKVESQKLDDITFQYNLVKLDVLEQQQKLRQQGQSFDSWSDPLALRNRLIVITPASNLGSQQDNIQTITASGASSHSAE